MKTSELVHHLRVLDCEQCYLCRGCKDPHKLKCFLFGEAADTLEAQQKRIKELEAERRWIPVAERLPEDLCPVLVSLKGLKKAFVGRYQDSEWWSEGASSRPFMLEVTHWMPMPEMMKEEEK